MLLVEHFVKFCERYRLIEERSDYDPMMHFVGNWVRPANPPAQPPAQGGGGGGGGGGGHGQQPLVRQQTRP